MWSSPFKTPKPKPPIEEAKFKKEKLLLSQSEAKKLLNCRSPLSEGQIGWVQRWLETLMREKSLPPQIVSNDAYGKLMEILSPIDALNTLENLRTDYLRAHPPDTIPFDDYSFLTSIEELNSIHSKLLPLRKAGAPEEAKE
jgi:hypothetical protein